MKTYLSLLIGIILSLNSVADDRVYICSITGSAGHLQDIPVLIDQTVYRELKDRKFFIHLLERDIPVLKVYNQKNAPKKSLGLVSGVYDDMKATYSASNTIAGGGATAEITTRYLGIEYATKAPRSVEVYSVDCFRKGNAVLNP
jgi:hypothetical protein